SHQGADAGFICDGSDGEVSVTLRPAPAMRADPSAALATSARAAAGVPATVRGSRGRSTLKRLPAPAADSTVTAPPCMSTMERTMARPKPEPLPRASLERAP